MIVSDIYFIKRDIKTSNFNRSVRFNPTPIDCRWLYTSREGLAYHLLPSKTIIYWEWNKDKTVSTFIKLEIPKVPKNKK